MPKSMTQVLDEFTSPHVSLKWQKSTGIYVPKDQEEYHRFAELGLDPFYFENEIDELLKKVSGHGYWLEIIGSPHEKENS